MAISMRAEGGIVHDAVRRMQADILRAQKAGVAGGTEHAKETIRRAIRAYSRSPRLPNIIGSEVYPTGTRLAYRPAGSIFARGPGGGVADRIVRQMESGQPITVRNRRFMAIPLHNMRSGAGQGRLAGPSEIKGLFYLPAKGGLGGYAGLLCVRKEDGIGTRAARGAARVRSRFRRNTDQRGIVPMFVLVRAVRGRKVFDQQEVVRNAMALMPGFIDRAFAQTGSGQPVRVAA